MSEERRIEIHVPALARVEGEGALDLVIEDGRIAELKLRIYEPPRLFEKLLEGRGYHEVADLVARICGICPVAYQMSAVQALEAILGLDPGPWVRAMRRVFYCGEWIESHSLHIHLLAAPDFFGCDNVTELAKRYPNEVRRGLRLQALGNDLIRLFGARSVHPVGARVGGFYHAPSLNEVVTLREKLRAALPEALALLQWTASLSLPASEQPFTSVALRHADEYPLNEGRIVSSRGLDIASEEYEQHFFEQQVPHSTALHSLLDGAPYLVGPLARINLNFERLPKEVQAALRATGITWPSANMYHSIVARAAEIYYALGEAVRLLENYSLPAAPYVEATARAGVGVGASEAPRGLLWHRYELDHSDEVLRARSEQIIRNYDPCISCATHFLDLRVQRR